VYPVEARGIKYRTKLRQTETQSGTLETLKVQGK
jgi:hypothetical protein